MEQRERDMPARQPEVLQDGELADLSTARAEADRLMRVADEAIARALSTDSELFLRANRQSVGQ